MGKGAIFKEICTTYTEYVTGKYGNAIVVFDGYQSKSTKDKTRNLLKCFAGKNYGVTARSFQLRIE